ncbi:MAG: Glycosyl hydrolases family 39 [Candidatus Brocadia sinica]|nr:MAG: Glycosyl hydrolases family 39 [Candidatus Brocadia sinica]
MKIFLSLLTILIVLTVKPFYTFSETIEMKVDAAKGLGPVPDLFSSSIWIVKANNRHNIERFFKDNHPKAIQFTFDLFLPKTKSLEDYKQKFKNEFFHPSGIPYLVVQKAKEADAELIVGFDPFTIPAWLSLRQGDKRPAFTHESWWTIEQLSPPRDFKLWGEVVGFALSFLRNELGVKKLGFFVGHEPNWLWMGTEESLFQYYEAAARSAKNVSSEIKVGGLGPWSLTAKKEGADFEGITPAIGDLAKKEGGWKNPKGEPLLKSFIEYVAKNNVPLDFINWHSFTHNSRQLVSDGKTVSQWLKEKNLDNVRIYISDWAYWAGWPYPDDYLDTEETASEAITALFHMWEGGVDWHGHDFDIQVDAHENSRRKERRNAEFIGDWPLFTKHGIIKPVYNSFKALTMATKPDGEKIPELLRVESSADDIIAISTMKDDGIYVLLSNFAPRQARLRSTVTKLLLEKSGFSPEEINWLKECIQEGKKSKRKDTLLACKDQFIARVKDGQKTEVVEFLANIYSHLQKKPSMEGVLTYLGEVSSNAKYPQTKIIASELSDTLKRTSSNKSLKIDFANLSFSPSAQATVYTIDSNNSNACKLNKKTEPSSTDTLCGIGGMVDKAVWQANADANTYAQKNLEDFLLSKGYSTKHLEILREKIRTAKNKGNLKELFDQLTKKGFQKKDIALGFRKLKAIRQNYLREQIDKINEWKEISLEGSKETAAVNVTKDTATLNISMEPNSVRLIILGKK